MKILLADSELELASDFLKRNKIFIEVENDEILDKGKHKFIFGTKESGRAGRPDIAYFFHVFLSNYVSDGLEYGIHTRNNKYIDWKDLLHVETYEEFKSAILPKLLSKDVVTLRELIAGYKMPIMLSQFGRLREIEYLRGREIIIIGGFPEGDYLSQGLNIEKVSIARKELTVPYVLNKLSYIL